MLFFSYHFSSIFLMTPFKIQLARQLSYAKRKNLWFSRSNSNNIYYILSPSRESFSMKNLVLIIIIILTNTDLDRL